MLQRVRMRKVIPYVSGFGFLFNNETTKIFKSLQYLFPLKIAAHDYNTLDHGQHTVASFAHRGCL